MQGLVSNSLKVKLLPSFDESVITCGNQAIDRRQLKSSKVGSPIIGRCLPPSLPENV